MRTLVTGGGGFIGHHLVTGLLAEGFRVSVIDDFSTGSRERLVSVLERIDLVEGSILDGDALDRAAEGCEVIFHEAALPSVARSLVDPVRTNEVNVAGTISVMQAAERAGARRVVMAGSSSVYGVPAELPCRESTVAKPVSPYGVSKLAAEHYVHTLGAHSGIDTVVLRYFNVFGPGQDPASEYAAVVPRFVTAALGGHRPIVNGTGEVSRDFTYVANVISANLLAASPDAPSGVTANVGCGSRTTLLGLLEAIAAALGRDTNPIFGPPRPGDIQHSLADITLAERELGYRVVVSFADGIERTIAWYRDQADARADIVA